MAELNAYSRWDYIPDNLSETDLSGPDAAAFADIYSRIMQERERVAAHAHARSGELLVWNPDGKRPPLFWCFNNWIEPVLLANRLDTDQPLYAMHSFHSFTERWDVKGRCTEALADRYLASVLPAAGNGRMIFGGNCQGAPVAESMAIQLSRRAGRLPFLITLDYIAKRGYRGSRLMVFGEHSDFNPFRSPPSPLPYWQNRQTHFSWAILDAAHGGYFREPTVGTVAQTIAAMSDWLIRTGQGPRGELQLSVHTEGMAG